MNWGRCEFRNPHVFFEAKAKKKKARTVGGLGPLSAEEEHCQPPCGPVVFGRMVGVMNCFPCVFGDSLCS